MRYASHLWLATAMGLPALTSAQTPAPPGACPPVLGIAREIEKYGHGAAHMENEVQWTAGQARAGSSTSLGMVSETGAAEAWWLIPYASFAEQGKQAGNPAFQVVNAKYSALDSPHVESARLLTAVLRPDMSAPNACDVSMAREMEVSTWRIRPGHDDHFAQAAKSYFEVMKRANVPLTGVMYQVVAGAPAGTYIAFNIIRSPADYDKNMAMDQKIGPAMTPEENASLNKFLTEGTISFETQRFRVDPNISIAGPDLIKADPAFWTPSWKKALPKKAAKP